jgi:hypothetical protein
LNAQKYSLSVSLFVNILLELKVIWSFIGIQRDYVLAWFALAKKEKKEKM